MTEEKTNKTRESSESETKYLTSSRFLTTAEFLDFMDFVEWKYYQNKGIRQAFQIPRTSQALDIRSGVPSFESRKLL